MKRLLMLCAFLPSIISFAQVGIGTTTPQAFLDVDGGSVRLSNYGSQTYSGTVSYLLGVETDGDIIEVSPNSFGTPGIQYYTWDIPNTTSPDIDNPRTLGIPSSSGLVTGLLDETTSDAIAPAADGYIILFQGSLPVDNTGNFTFNSDSDDGSRIYIDGVLVLDDWINQGTGSVASATINLAAGLHKIEFWFYENAGGDAINFTWGTNPDGYTVGDYISGLELLVE